MTEKTERLYAWSDKILQPYNEDDEVYQFVDQSMQKVISAEVQPDEQASVKECGHVSVKEYQSHNEQQQNVDTNFIYEYNKSLLNSTDALNNYRDSETDLSKILINHFIAIIWVIIVSTIIATGCSIYFRHIDVAIITSVLGILMDLIATSILKVVMKNYQSKQQYFKEQIAIQKDDKIYGLIITMSDETKKMELIDLIVRAHINKTTDCNKKNTKKS